MASIVGPCVRTTDIVCKDLYAGSTLDLLYLFDAHQFLPASPIYVLASITTPSRFD